MRELPLQPNKPAGCTLNADGLLAQLARADRIRSAIIERERDADELRLRFGAEVDSDALALLVETERACCSFFRIDYDDASRSLRIAVELEHDRSALDALERALVS